MPKDLQTTQSVSNIRCSQSVSSTQTLEFQAIINQQVEAHTTHLVVEIERLSAEIVELRRLNMERKLHMGGICASLY